MATITRTSSPDARSSRERNAVRVMVAIRNSAEDDRSNRPDCDSTDALPPDPDSGLTG